MNEEIKEILSKLLNRKQETLLQGLRECQLKNIEHPFITKEEYIDKTLNYINTLQQENQSLKAQIDLLEDNRKYLNNKMEKVEKFCKEQKQKMYKSRNKIAVFVLSKIEDLLKGDDK